ncbi:C45 family autoproteolytic acyltransferase/hydrolase [Rhodococcus sp. NPDC056960]|uniref:C45 family autoproteolytic acyltransferase/hydolase n=1 Tax=Rhodococcus sp. NPDC056960 TaxID=3345982 RepID=UPI0036327814
MTDTHPTRTLVRVDDTRPRERGLARGEQLRDTLSESLALYLRLFDTVGVSEDRVRDGARRLTDIVAAWDSRYAEEIGGVAAGAGLEAWQVMALNGRTEILAQATGTRPGECSTLAYTGTGPLHAPFGVQTWDWHQELDPYWHTHEVSGTRHSFVGLTEHGILGKIGMNSAGLGVFFNILSHRDDAPAGVPVHLLSAAVLGEAGSVEEALDLLRSAPIATSGALTLLDAHSVVCAEVSPAGVATLRPTERFLAHTNHFLDPANAEREKRGLYEPDSQDRYGLIASRVRRYAEPTEADHLVEYLYSDPGQPQLCCVPAPDAVFGQRWATLATVLLEPGRRRVRVLAGTPIDARRRPWITLDATESADVTGR